MNPVLILAANPADTDRLRWEAEVKRIQNALPAAQFIVHVLPQAGIDELQVALQRYQPRIVHFCGHGKQAGLLFHDAHEQAKLVPLDALAELFQLSQRGLDCVVLNACWSQPQAEAIHAHIPVVAGMNQAIHDDDALDFASGFYRALGNGRTYADAFDLGRNQIRLGDSSGGNTPMLLCRQPALTPPRMIPRHYWLVGGLAAAVLVMLAAWFLLGPNVETEGDCSPITGAISGSQIEINCSTETKDD